MDQNVRFQQNLATLPVPVGIIVAPDNRFDTLAPYAPAVLILAGTALDLRIGPNRISGAKSPPPGAAVHLLIRALRARRLMSIIIYSNVAH